MIIYVIMFAACVFFAFMSQRKRISVPNEDGTVIYKPKKGLVILSAIPLIFFCGMRGGIADTSAYIHTFQEMDKDVITDQLKHYWDNKDVGFKVFTFLVKCLTDNYTVWLFIIAIVTTFFLWRTFYRYSDSFTFSVFLFFGTTSFSWMFNGMRQYIAVSAMFAMFPLLIKTGDAVKDKRNLIKFILATVVLATIHMSAIVILPFFILCRGEILGRWQVLTALGFVVFSSFVTPFTNFIMDLFADTQYGNIANDFSHYDGASIFRLLIAAVPVFLGVIKVREIKNVKDPLFKFCFNMSLFNVCFWVPAVIISGNVFGRFTEYCNVFNLLLFPMVVERLYAGQFKRFLKVCIVFVYVFWFYYQMKLTWNWGYISPVLGSFA